MPRNAYLTLQCAYGVFQKNCRTISGNGLVSYKILTMPENTKFIRITYTCECGFAEITRFRMSQSANVKENATTVTHRQLN
ncbi:hypothetical protein Hanom_Chr14g01322861 [Helianthus anomalus]